MSMEMDHSFTVPVPPDRAWDVLLDVERIAPCMPGATVDEFDGEVVTGRIKVKVGPVSLTYRGTAKFTERDPDARVVVVEASGKETRGAGTASATVRASLEPESSGQATKVSMHTVMNVTGRPAQFGRGVMVEVGGKLVERFAENLAQLIAGDGAPGAAGTATGSAATGSAATGSAATGSAATGSAATGSAATGSAAAGGAAAGGAAAGSAAAEGAAAEGAAAGGASTGPAASATAEAEAASAEPATAIPVTSTATAPPPQASEDSIDLVSLVGPAILKRVVPVAIGLAGLILLLRSLRHRARRSGQNEEA